MLNVLSVFWLVAQAGVALELAYYGKIAILVAGVCAIVYLILQWLGIAIPQKLLMLIGVVAIVLVGIIAINVLMRIM